MKKFMLILGVAGLSITGFQVQGSDMSVSEEDLSESVRIRQVEELQRRQEEEEQMRQVEELQRQQLQQEQMEEAEERQQHEKDFEIQRLHWERLMGKNYRKAHNNLAKED